MCLKMVISLKKSTFSPEMGFRGKIAVLRHLEGFLEKSEESRNNLGLLSDIFHKEAPIMRYQICI